jgi:hypothetical protein
MPRFVILEHQHQGVHWDFMLEAGGGLRTWRLDEPPSQAAAIMARAIAEHRLFYLDYEGSVSGGRGTVHRWDSGAFEWLEDRPGRVVVRIAGRRVAGAAYLVSDASGIWTFRLASADALGTASSAPAT